MRYQKAVFPEKRHGHSNVKLATGQKNKYHLTLSQALEGFELHVQARHLSQNTINDYFTTFAKFQEFLGDDLLIEEITSQQIEKFLASLSNRKKKTVLNYYTGLSALWTWAVTENLIDVHIVRQVEPPEPEDMEIIPFTQQEVRLMLLACERSRSYSRPGQLEKCSNSLPHSERNKAIILTLLDTGLRASELCNAKIADIDLKNKRITVMGKGAKERTVRISSRTAKAIWRYLTTRPELTVKDPLFASSDDLSLSRYGLRRLIHRIGQRADVHNAYPHRFRHTFAINFLRNGGNIFVLQELLGHSTLEMVKRYLKLAEQDAESSHRIASPVANWNL